MTGEIEVQFEGHLGADAAVKRAGDAEVVELRVAVGVRRRDAAGEWNDVRTDWVDVAGWGRLVGSLSGLKRGQRVSVRGVLVPGAYLTKAGEAANGDRVVARSVGVIPPAPEKTAAGKTPAHA